MPEFQAKLIQYKYHPLRVYLHWFSAAVIIWALISGFYSTFGTSSPNVKTAIGFINVSVTTIYLPFFILRLLSAVCLYGPTYPVTDDKVHNQIAKGMHIALYVVTTVVMITGVLMMSRDISVFGVFTISQPITDERLISWFKILHIISNILLSMMVTAHLIAVIAHKAKGRNIIFRMST